LIDNTSPPTIQQGISRAAHETEYFWPWNSVKYVVETVGKAAPWGTVA
jgi:hypothetical protein